MMVLFAFIASLENPTPIFAQPPASFVFVFQMVTVFINNSVNSVAVSDHVFHRFPFDLLIQVSATQLSLFLCIPFVLMATDRAFEDAVHTTLPGSPAPLSSFVGSPNGFLHVLEGTGYRARTMEEKSTKSTYSYRFSCKTRPELKIASRRLLRQWPPSRLRLQVLNKLLGASLLVLPLWKQVQPLALAAPTRQDLGLGLSGPMPRVIRRSTAKPISQSASPSHLKTENSEDNLRLVGKFCPQNSENSVVPAGPYKAIPNSLLGVWFRVCPWS